MTYTLCVIAETLRLSSVAPIGAPHRAMSDQSVNGYFIPKGTILIPNLRFIHMNPEIWGDPQSFRPERFLTEDGTFKGHESLIPFSVGKRKCVGENMANDVVFLFTTNLLQKFSIEFDKNGEDHGYEPKLQFFTTPKSFNVIFRERL